MKGACTVQYHAAKSPATQYAYLHVMITCACVLYLQMLRVYPCIPVCTRVYCWTFRCTALYVRCYSVKHATVHRFVATPPFMLLCLLTLSLYRTIISSPYCLDYCYKVVEVGNMTTKLHVISRYDICHNIPLVHDFIYSKILSTCHVFGFW